ncbi:hypothetical protein BJV74DRAFT_835062 [Russula compacta]|nr:hypothetical protein BJV74DRAFT_835062 [Russula compacta]
MTPDNIRSILDPATKRPHQRLASIRDGLRAHLRAAASNPLLHCLTIPLAWLSTAMSATVPTILSVFFW